MQQKKFYFRHKFNILWLNIKKLCKICSFMILKMKDYLNVIAGPMRKSHFLSLGFAETNMSCVNLKGPKSISIFCWRLSTSSTLQFNSWNKQFPDRWPQSNSPWCALYPILTRILARWISFLLGILQVVSFLMDNLRILEGWKGVCTWLFCRLSESLYSCAY